jgi:superoxide dismutase, Cu-Zn family
LSCFLQTHRYAKRRIGLPFKAQAHAAHRGGGYSAVAVYSMHRAAVCSAMKPKTSKPLSVIALVAIAVTLTLGNAFAQEPTKAIAVLHSASGSQVTGTVTFTKTGDTVSVVADITGLTPGKHGFHIHEFGDCSAADASSAGGHFNPMHKPHGAPDSAERHAGDMGNLEADSTGKAHLELKDSMLKLSGENSILGRGVIVHEKVDDWSQPTGNAGGRLACGVIGVAKP